MVSKIGLFLLCKSGSSLFATGWSYSSERLFYIEGIGAFVTESQRGKPSSLKETFITLLGKHFFFNSTNKHQKQRSVHTITGIDLQASLRMSWSLPEMISLARQRAFIASGRDT